MVAPKLYEKYPQGNFIYDAFVIYAKKDNRWVFEELLTNLGRQEDQLNNQIIQPAGAKRYKFCIDEKDFIIGEEIHVNISLAITHSRCLLMFVTKAFIRSKWCQEEAIRAKYYTIDRQGLHKMIAVVEPTIFTRRSLPVHIKEILDTITCLEWPADKTRRPKFWLRLTKALGEPSVERQDEDLLDIV